MNLLLETMNVLEKKFQNIGCFSTFRYHLLFQLLQHRQAMDKLWSASIVLDELFMMLTPPTILISVLIALASFKVMMLSLRAVLIGCALQPCLEFAEKKSWMRFLVNSDLSDIRTDEQENDDEVLISWVMASKNMVLPVLTDGLWFHITSANIGHIGKILVIMSILVPILEGLYHIE